MIRVGRPDLELGDVNGRAVIDAVCRRADADANVFKDGRRCQAAARREIKCKIKFVGFDVVDKKHRVAGAAGGAAFDAQHERKRRWILRG